MNYKSNKFSTDNPTNILLTKFLKINWVIVLCVVFLGLWGLLRYTQQREAIGIHGQKVT